MLRTLTLGAISASYERWTSNCPVTVQEPVLSVSLTACPGEQNRYSDSLRSGGYGDRIPVGGEIFRTCPDRPWGRPNLLYRIFPGGKAARDVVLNTQPNLAPRLKKEWSYTSTPPLCLRGLFQGDFYLYLLPLTACCFVTFRHFYSHYLAKK